MSQPVVSEEPLARVSAVLSDNGIRLVAAAAGLTVLGLSVASPAFGLATISAGAALAALAVLGQLVMFRRNRRSRAAAKDVSAFAGHDPSPCFVTAPDGEVRYANAAAQKRFRLTEGGTLVRALGDLFANPSGVLFRIQEKARAVGGAREDVITRRGHIRLTVVELNTAGFLWRFEEVAEARSTAKGAEALSLPMMIVAQSGTILFMNEAMRSVLGSRAKHLDRVIADLPIRAGGVHQVAAASGPVLCRVAEIESANGRSELYFLPAEPGAVADSAPRSEASNEELPVGLLELSPNGEIVSANRLARELLVADSGEEILGVALADRLEGLGRPVRDWIDEAVRGRGLGRPEVLRVKAPDVEAFVQVTLGRIQGSGEVRLVAVLNDATELKTLEAQFVQSQKMQAIGQLAGGVAHDFNNLLTAISGHCDLMLLRHDQGDPDYGDLVQIHQNANRAASLVGQLLAFSRKQTLQPQIIDLRDTLSDLTHLLNRLVGERITLVLNHEIGLPPIRADRRQLEQVIMNLVVNARDAMPEGGEIRIETMERVLGEELRRDRAQVPPGRYVVVKVEDHGSGIAPDKLTKIFEPFYTTKRTGEGTGLGLSTAYGIVKQSGGFIFVDSVVAVGTVFTLYFPAQDHPAEHGQAASSGTAAAPTVVWNAASQIPSKRSSGAAALAIARDFADDEVTGKVAALTAIEAGPERTDLGVLKLVASAGAQRPATRRAGLEESRLEAPAAVDIAEPDLAPDEAEGGDDADEQRAAPVLSEVTNAADDVADDEADLGLWAPDRLRGIAAEVAEADAAEQEAEPPAEPPANPDRIRRTRRNVSRRRSPTRDGRDLVEPEEEFFGQEPPEESTAESAAESADRAPSNGHPVRPQAGHSPADRTEVPIERIIAAVAKVDTNQTSGEGVILLVEDEAPVRAFASRALRMRGFTVLEAESAEEALATLEDPTLKVDVFVTDVIMPGMDGPSWVRKALVDRPHVKVVFVSGYAEDSFCEEQSRIPNSVFLPKPFSLSELTATVQDQIH